MTDGARRPGPADPRRPPASGPGSLPDRLRSGRSSADEPDEYHQDDYGRGGAEGYRPRPDPRRAGRETRGFDAARRDERPAGSGSGHHPAAGRGAGERGYTGRADDWDGSGPRRQDEPHRRDSDPRRGRGYRDVDGDASGSHRPGGPGFPPDRRQRPPRPGDGVPAGPAAPSREAGEPGGRRTGRPAGRPYPDDDPYPPGGGGRQDGRGGATGGRPAAGRPKPDDAEPDTGALFAAPPARARGGTGRFASRPGEATGERTRAGGRGGGYEAGRHQEDGPAEGDEGGFSPSRGGGTGPRRKAPGTAATRSTPTGTTGTTGPGRRAAVGREDGTAGGADEPGIDEPGARAPEVGLGLFLRRLVIALVWLGFALGLGVGAGVVWEKVRPSGEEATAGPSPTPSTTQAPTAPPSEPPPSSSPTPAVPSDWVAANDSASGTTWSHPGTWTMRQDSVGIFYGEPSGARMVGVARRTGVDGAGALSKVQALEFGGQPGLAVTGSGDVKDTFSGATVRELTGSYTRQGEKVSYLMRTVETPNAVYVLIARAPAASDAELDTLMASLRASFQPPA
ncbi:hypothetical protein I6A84_11710 [Frankia sp. CNm7]|uniref:hypothetical protein n=1 Tax=Frankia nepalensis TaxID=1836974 RepID=UPI001933E664|nr:hypothetical protein [Frankia nepalensis]MBL7518759.1 hypothetical protein [Frankia nepalensis]